MTSSSGRVRPRRAGASERGQVVIMVALAAIVLVAAVGVAIDVGRLYITRAELSRAVDAAALAGVVELPNLTNAQTRAQDYLAENEPSAVGSVVPDVANNALEVSASKTINTFFVRLVGIETATVHSRAKAGFGVAYLDVVILLDATGSMQGTDINNAKEAAQQFRSTLLGASPNGRTVIGIAPFRGCYRSARQTAIAPMPLSKSNCVNADSQVTYLTSNSSTLQSRINAIDAVGGSGTNVCGGLLMGKEILNGPNNHIGEENARRYLILLSDGDNTYNSYSYQSSPASPHTQCRPTTSSNNSDGNVGTNCSSAQTRERQIDVKTYQQAQSLKAEGVEIFVVGFGVCDHDSSPVYSAAQCSSSIGDTSHDDTADERLLKCMASSSPGTNDHYFWASSSSQLPTIFSQIANQIAHRLIE